ALSRFGPLPRPLVVRRPPARRVLAALPAGRAGRPPACRSLPTANPPQTRPATAPPPLEASQPLVISFSGNRGPNEQARAPQVCLSLCVDAFDTDAARHELLW